MTKLSLLLKVLEGETHETLASFYRLFQERALPDLGANIKCGNSLIGPDFFEGKEYGLLGEEERYRINPFDWHAEFPEVFSADSPGFDAVIGNPPYARIQVLQESYPEQVPYLKARYAVTTGSFDIYGVFIERALSLLISHDGHLGFIVPHKFFPAKFAEPLRALIAKGRRISHIVHFGYNRVFRDADTYTCLLFLTTRPNDWFRMVEILDAESAEATLQKASRLQQVDTPEFRVGRVPAPVAGSAKWHFKIGRTGSLMGKLGGTAGTLANVVEKVGVGLQTSADDVYILTTTDVESGDSGDLVIRLWSASLEKEAVLERAAVKPFLLGRDVRRYQEPKVTRYVLFPYRIEHRKTLLYSEDELADLYPKAHAYLCANRKRLEDRERGRFEGSKWYAFGRTNNLGEFEQPKILMRELGSGPNFIPDYCGLLYHTAKVYFVVPKGRLITMNALLGLLNSRVCSFYVGNTSEIWGKSFKFKTQFVTPLPVPLDRLEDPIVGKLDTLVQTMLDLHKRLAAAKTAHEKTMLQRHITATDHQIDQLVYALYGLTEEEMKIVEDGA